MGKTDELFFTSQEDWREWLAKNHDRVDETWLIIYKRHTGEKNITYPEALEEALCFGWIDSRLKRIDDEKHKIRFTPRKSSNWSDHNLRTSKKMIARGRMTEHGLKWLEGIDLSEVTEKPVKRPIEVPKWLEEAIKANPVAWETFSNLAPSRKRHYVGWITSAKREETRQRRLNRAIGFLEKGNKLPLM